MGFHFNQIIRFDLHQLWFPQIIHTPKLPILKKKRVEGGGNPKGATKNYNASVKLETKKISTNNNKRIKQKNKQQQKQQIKIIKYLQKLETWNKENQQLTKLRDSKRQN